MRYSIKVNIPPEQVQAMLEANCHHMDFLFSPLFHYVFTVSPKPGLYCALKDNSFCLSACCEHALFPRVSWRRFSGNILRTAYGSEIRGGFQLPKMYLAFDFFCLMIVVAFLSKVSFWLGLIIAGLVFTPWLAICTGLIYFLGKAMCQKEEQALLESLHAMFEPYNIEK